MSHRLYSPAMTSIRFGTDGWRGVIAEDFTFANARVVAQVIARYVERCENASNGVIIGYDYRFASDGIATAAAEVVSASGTPVFLTDKPCPTPAVSLLVRQRGAAGGLMITASHNPYQWNGIKYKASYGSSALPSIVAQIEKDLDVVQKEMVVSLPPRKSLIQPLEPRAPYLDTLEKLVDWQRLRKAKFRFVSDVMHGSATGLLVELFRRNGISCDEIRVTRDPRFGGVHPEPIEPHIEPLRQTVLAGKFDAGLCADGDGDRIGAIDRDGTFVNPHQIFALLAWHGKSLGELLAVLTAEFGEYHYGRVDLGLKPGQKEKAMAHFSDAKLIRILDVPVVRREDMDGIKLYLSDVGWVMVRASGTENLLRVYCETSKSETTQRVLQAVTGIVQNL